MKQFLSRAILVGLCVLGLLNCGGGGSSGSGGGGGRIRFLNAIPELHQVQLFLNDNPDPVLLNYGDLIDYEGFDTVEVRLLVAGSPVPLINQQEKLTKGVDKTMSFLGDPNPKPPKYTVGTDLVEDKHESGSNNRFLLRVVDEAVSTHGLPGLKVFITKPGVSLDNILPVKEGLSFSSNTGYIEGNESPAVVTILYDKTVKKQNQRTVLYQSQPIDLTATPVMSIFLIDQPGRGLPVQAVFSPDSSF
jgi:hypothetical protein